MMKNNKIKKAMDKVNVELLFTISNAISHRENLMTLLGEYFKIESLNESKVSTALQSG